jgi:1-acyl-sn-glycerol-3-phosphate acyltransferase
MLFTAFFLLWTFLYAIFFVIACLFLPFRGRFALAQVWARVILAVLRWTCRLDHRVEGRERLPPGNHIALMKHSSSWETVAQTLLVPPHVWLLKRELLWIPFVGWGIRQLRAIGVDRGGGSLVLRDVIEQGKARLAEGEWIMIFPEGTRMPPGETRKYGISGALLASQTGVLIVPVAHDAGYYWPRRSLWKKPGTIRVVIGPPIEAAGRDPREINEEAQAWIEAHSTHAT